MATKVIKAPLILQVTTRGYAQAAPSFKREVKFQSCVLPNKTVIAALDNGSPLTRITVAFKAGARYEPVNELGISHVLRSSAGLTTKHASGFISSRKLQQIGANLICTGDKEFIYYTLETTQENFAGTLEHLNNIISDQEFRPWELDDNMPRLKFDIVSLSPQVRAVDLLHKAAFRRGLGNSLFISPKKIGKISSESLQHYATNNLSLDRCAIAVVGDNLDRAKLFAQTLKVAPSGSGACDNAKYNGGDLRKEMGGDLAHVALSLQGAAAGSPQALALAVAARALGNGPVTKWGNDNSPLAKAIGNVGPFAAAGFNTTYTDAGLFGVVLSVAKDEASAAVKAVGKLLKNPTLSNEAVNAGKNQLKLQILSEAEDGSAVAEAIVARALSTGQLTAPADLAAAVDKITQNDVNAALSAAAKSKLSMGAAGNLSHVPYSDEL